MTDKPYRELFFIVCTYMDVTHFYRCDEIDNPPMAEVSIPVDTEEALYSVTCYLAAKHNDEIAIFDGMSLQNLFQANGIPE